MKVEKDRTSALFVKSPFVFVKSYIINHMWLVPRQASLHRETAESRDRDRSRSFVATRIACEAIASDPIADLFQSKTRIRR
jgi:hypothetical protein